VASIAQASYVTIYAYDPQGRLTGRSYLDGTADSFSYAGAGRLATASNQNIGYTFGYDIYGRLQSQTDNSGNVVAYTYDSAGRRISLTVNGATTSYVYDGQDIAAMTSGGVLSMGRGG